MTTKHADANSALVHGRYWYFVENISSEDESSADVLIYVSLPVSHNGQRISNLRLSPEPFEIVIDEINGNRIAIWRQRGFCKGETASFYYDFDLEYSPINCRLDAEKLEECDSTSEECKRYTVSEPWVDISEPIVSKAGEIASRYSDPLSRVRAIFDWVVNNMRYEYPDIAMRGAGKAFAMLRGDCGEFARVFVALCRAAGIPARTVTAKWLEPGGHVWAEFFLKPLGWCPADTTLAHLIKVKFPGMSDEWFKRVPGMPLPAQDWLLGNLYPKRLIVTVGDNIRVRSEKLGSEKIFSYMQPGGVHAHPDGVDCRGFSTKPVHDGFFLFGEESMDPDYAAGLAAMELADSYFENRLYDKAEAGYRKKLELKPTNAEAWLSLGKVLQSTGRFKLAIEAFSKVLSSTGGSLKPVWDALARFHTGNCLDMLSDRPAALEQYEMVVKSGVAYEGLQDKVKRYLVSPYVGS